MLLKMEKQEEIISNENYKKKGKKQRDCLIHLLTGQEFRCQVSRQAIGSELLKQIFDLLNIVESDYFGLYFKDLAEQRYWLEPGKSIKKQIKNGPFSFFFSVKFYPPDPAQLLEDITRYYMVLQIRDDIVGGRLPCSFVTHALLGSYVVQSELGDYERGEMRGNYVHEFSFAPNQTRDLEERIMELHKTHRGQTPEQAERNYLENAKKLSMYGVDLHVAKDSDGILLYVGICWNGILVYRDGALINRFAWPRVIKLSYLRSKFFITIRLLDGDERLSMIGFKMPNHRAAKTVWKSGVEHHGFFRLTRAENQRRPPLVRVGSKFRYSGRTQQETRSSVAKNRERVAPKVVRTDSRRLRSGWAGVPVKTKLVPVAEEESFEEVPPLPEKTHRKTKKCVITEEQITEEVVVTTTSEVFEVQKVETEESPWTETVKKVSEEEQPVVEVDDASLIFESEDHKERGDIPNLAMTEHQKSVHRLKISNSNQKAEVPVRFLESETPRKADSQDSLDMIDSRLSPRKSAEPAESKELREKTNRTNEVVETVTVIQYKETTAPQHSAIKTDEKLPAVVIPEEAPDVAERLKEDKSDSKSSLSSSVESDAIPFVASPDEESLSSSSKLVHTKELPPLNGNSQSSDEDPESSYVVTPPDESVTKTSVFNNRMSPREPIQIATVETRTVRVEEAVIPQEKNEIHHVSLTTNGDDRLVVSPAKDDDDERSSVSSLSSSSSSSASPSSSSSERNFYQPPTVKTAPLVVDSYVEETPTSTTNPPMVQTELKTITYESTESPSIEVSQPQLVSSQIITSETEHVVTTTEITKTVHGQVSETRVEKQMITIGNTNVDHNKAMAEMILDTQRNNPNINITKVEVHEERVLSAD